MKNFFDKKMRSFACNLLSLVHRKAEIATMSRRRSIIERCCIIVDRFAEDLFWKYEYRCAKLENREPLECL